MKLFNLIALVLMSHLNLNAQGIVGFANTSSTAVTYDDGAGVQLLPVGSRFLVSLYYAPNASLVPEDFVFQVLGNPTSISLTFGPGRFAGGNRTTPETTLPAENAWFQVRSWESLFGASYEDALMAGPQTVNGVTRLAILGASNKFNIPTGTPSAGGAIPITIPGGLEPFCLRVIPEPSVTILTVVGLLSMLLFRPWRRGKAA